MTLEESAEPVKKALAAYYRIMIRKAFNRCGEQWNKGLTKYKPKK